jgi:hypothetical protein
MQASHDATLDLPHFPFPLNQGAHKASDLPGLNKTLISLGQLCDNGCDYVLLDKQYASIIKDGIATIIGLRDPSNGMWLADITPTGVINPYPAQHPTYQNVANSAYEQTNKTQLIHFLHRTCFSPVLSTWIQAIDKGFFTTWPGLTAEAVRKFLPKSLATAKGHLKASPKNLRSTKIKPNNTPDASTTMTTPLPEEEPTVRTQFVYAKVVTVTGQIYSDQTGRFPVTSSRGNKYIMIVYDYDSTAILAEPIKNRSEAELLRAYSLLHEYLTDRGLKPQLQELDNECSSALRQFMRQEHVDFQLVPPYDHRQNAQSEPSGSGKIISSRD